MKIAHFVEPEKGIYAEILQEFKKIILWVKHELNDATSLIKGPIYVD